MIVVARKVKMYRAAERNRVHSLAETGNRSAEDTHTLD